jgi:hypothetical protein
MNNKGGQSLTNQIGSSAGARIPNRFKWGQDIQPSVSASRKLYRIVPITGSTGTPGQIIRWEIPNVGIADFKNSVLMFNASASQTGGSWIRFSNYIGTVIKKIRIMWGDEEICDVNDYNYIASMLLTIFTSSENLTNVGPFYGWDTTANRNANAAGRHYLCPILLDCLVTKPWPVFLCPQKLVIEMTLDQPANCLEADGTGTSPTYSLTNFEWQYDVYEMPASYRSSVENTPLRFTFTNVTLVKQPLSTANQDFIISEKNTCMNHLLAVFRTVANNTLITALNKFTTWNWNNVTSYQIRHEGHYHPPQPVLPDPVNGDQAFYHYLRSIDSWNFFNGGATNCAFSQILPSSFVSNQFMMHIDLETFPGHGLLDGKNSLMSTENLVFNVQCTVPGSAQTFDTFCFSQYAVMICGPKLKVIR